MDSGTESVAHTKFHETCKELGDATEEDSQTKDGLVRADATKGVGSGKSL